MYSCFTEAPAADYEVRERCGEFYLWSSKWMYVCGGDLERRETRCRPPLTLVQRRFQELSESSEELTVKLVNNLSRASMESQQKLSFFLMMILTCLWTIISPLVHSLHSHTILLYYHLSFILLQYTGNR